MQTICRFVARFCIFFVGIALLGGTNLTAPINDYVDGYPTYKYASITDMIYKAVFHENAKQYKELLKLKPKDITLTAAQIPYRSARAKI